MSAAYLPDVEMEGDLPEVSKNQADANRVLANIRSPNLAAEVESTVLARLGAKVCEEFLVDEKSLSESGWRKRHDDALKLAMQVKETKSYPWPNAANVKYPLITVAAIQFAARAYPAIVDGSNVAKGKVLGKPSPEKQATADRIGRHMSYQLLDEMTEWEEGTDELLHILPVTGTVFRKTYFDPAKGRNCSELVTADKMVVNYSAKAEPVRMTQVCEYYPHEITAKIRSGLWIEQDLGLPANAANDDDAPHTFYEQHRLWDLDEDGYPEPYIVTVHKETQRVVRIYARYDESGVEVNEQGEVYSITPVSYFTRYRFIPSLDGSYYGIGFGILLDALNETINSTINQLLDAGHLANTGGGFLGAGAQLKAGSLRFTPGEWKKVEPTGGVLKDSIVPLPVREPSSVLFSLLGLLIDAARDITATKDILTGEAGSTNQPVGTTLALIEQGMKVFSAIYKRIHRALKHELGLLFRLNRLYLQPEVYFTFQDDEGVVGLDDYRDDSMDVVPVSDPTVVTDMQRMGRAQFLMQFRPDPLMNGAEINKRVLEAASIPDVPGLFAKPQEGPDPQTAMALKDQELRERELKIKENESEASITQKIAQAQKTTVEALLMAPDFQAQVAQFIDQRVAEIIGNGQPAQPGGPGGMAPAPLDPGLSPVPEGPPPGDGGAMGLGGEPGFEPAGEGGPPGEFNGPGVG